MQAAVGRSSAPGPCWRGSAYPSASVKCPPCPNRVAVAVDAGGLRGTRHERGRPPTAGGEAREGRSEGGCRGYCRAISSFPRSHSGQGWANENQSHRHTPAYFPGASSLPRPPRGLNLQWEGTGRAVASAERLGRACSLRPTAGACIPPTAFKRPEARHTLRTRGRLHQFRRDGSTTTPGGRCRRTMRGTARLLPPQRSTHSTIAPIPLPCHGRSHGELVNAAELPPPSSSSANRTARSVLTRPHAQPRL